MSKQIPEFLQEMLIKQYGEELTQKIIQGYSKKRPVTLRVNTIKTDTEKVKKDLSEQGIKFKEIQWNKQALILENVNEEKVKQLDIYENGEIYLQSLSSMIPPVILNPEANENILDMTAAPGGKTTQMAALSNNQAMITACEKNKIRAERLKYNLEKQGANKVTVMLQDARQLDEFFSFDKILLDAPCSGSGTIKIQDEKLEKTFTRELVERSVKTQEKLLEKALKLLKPGREMMYSTCSILAQENENILKKVLAKANAEIVPIETDFKTELLPVTISGTICIVPTELYEGFFVAKIKKNK